MNNKEHNDSTRKAFDELSKIAEKDNKDLNIHFIDPVKQMILNKNTVYVLTALSFGLGYLIASIT